MLAIAMKPLAVSRGAEKLKLLANPGDRAKSINYEARPKAFGSALSTETAG